MYEQLRIDISQWLASIGINSRPAEGLPTVILLVSSILIAIALYVVAKRVATKAAKFAVRGAKSNWRCSFANFKVLEKTALLAPILLLNLLIPIILTEHALLANLFDKLLSTAIIMMLTLAIFSALDAINEITNINRLSKKIPVKSFIQLLKLFLFFVSLILIIADLSGQSPVYFLSGLGVATGFVMLIFKDTILGFVAGIQLAANRMVAVGDWIQMDKYGANGDIEEISLTTVKVRNFDQTITMIPAYSLVQDSFMNWRGMKDSGGRRIRRSIFIDVTSIRILTNDDIERLSKINLLKDYFLCKQTEINAYNEGQPNNDELINCRQLTNLGTFRAYVLEYGRKNVNIYTDFHNDKTNMMALMVRLLAPTTAGLPLEIYMFATTTKWIEYENIQSDIFEHIYSVLPTFGLRSFQIPTGQDLKEFRKC